MLRSEAVLLLRGRGWGEGTNKQERPGSWDLKSPPRPCWVTARLVFRVLALSCCSLSSPRHLSFSEHYVLGKHFIFTILRSRASDQSRLQVRHGSQGCSRGGTTAAVKLELPLRLMGTKNLTHGAQGLREARGHLSAGRAATAFSFRMTRNLWLSDFSGSCQIPEKRVCLFCQSDFCLM